MSGPHRKPSANIYTALLAIALAALIVATIFAYLETSDYEGDQKYRGAPNVVQAIEPGNLDAGWYAQNGRGCHDVGRAKEFV